MESTHFLLKRSTYIYVSIVIYVCAFLFFLYIGLHSDNLKNIENNSGDIIKENYLIGDNSVQTFSRILLNNEIYIIKNYIGIFTLGIYPIILLWFNASFFGIIVGRVISEKGLQFVFIHTLPHSIELVAVILAAADSIFLGIIIFLKYLKYYNCEIKYRTYFYNFVYYIVIILIAAFIETYVSLKI